MSCLLIQIYISTHFVSSNSNLVMAVAAQMNAIFALIKNAR